MFDNVVYISRLKPDFDVVELERELRLDGNPENLIIDVVTHGNDAVFLAFADYRIVDKVVAQCNGNMLLGTEVEASRLTNDLVKILTQLDPNFTKKGSQTEVKQGGRSQPPNPLSLDAAKGQTKSLTGLGDILEAFDNLSVDHQALLKTALQLKPTIPPLDVRTKTSSPNPTTSCMNMGPQQPIHTPNMWQQGVAPDQSFQFGHPNVSSIRVSTFSGGPKDCSFEQFRYDVQSLLKQGCSEALVLTAIRRSIKTRRRKSCYTWGREHL